ncbi:MAG: zinc ribbon domain-containing protein [Chloroflexi bacterium]|nr:zinc ribbon domain-containing protein [Chloroflexota bacterium]
MRCSNCGNEVPETANVCGYCGHRLKTNKPVSTSQPETHQVQQTSRGIPGWVWGLGGLLLVGGIVVVAGFIFLGASGLFAPTSNNQSNQPVEPAAPIQVVTTATPPSAVSSSSEAGWVVVFEDDFSNPNETELEINELREIVDGEYRQRMDGGGYSAGEILLPVHGNFRVSFDIRMIYAESGLGGWDFSILTQETESSKEFTVWSQMSLLENGNLFVTNTDANFDWRPIVEETVFPGVGGVGEVNQVLIEGVDSTITVWFNHRELFQFDHPVDGLVHYFGWSVLNVTEVGFDNFVIEEYRIP